jgi:hypothetical protein
LEEFCRTGTGDRPQSVNWVEAVDFNGERAKGVAERASGGVN